MSAGPLLTSEVHERLKIALDAGLDAVKCSLDLGRSIDEVKITGSGWIWKGRMFPYPDFCKERTVYYWSGTAFEAAARYGGALIKLVPTDWGPPTFEIDGIKMLPTAQVSPFADAQRKVALIEPRGKSVLDVCGGLGYFAEWCLRGGAHCVLSFEKNPDVIWLRSLNPWSPENAAALERPGVLALEHVDAVDAIAALPDRSFDAILHDPPRFGIAGELYSLAFYGQLARVIRPGGRLFHYTGSPNKLSSRRDLPAEVLRRLQKAGFAARVEGDGVLAEREGLRRHPNRRDLRI